MNMKFEREDYTRPKSDHYLVGDPGRQIKSVNLALQGGGAHGAFAWGVLDKILEDGRLWIDGLSAASAGAMNAVVFAYALHKHGKEGARKALRDFWFDVATTSKMYSPFKNSAWEAMMFGWENLDHVTSFYAFDAFTKALSPYQFNPLNINPLKKILERHVDFDELHDDRETKLFISATNVRTNRIKVFKNTDVCVDAVMASACIPILFQAVEIDGESYWDGGYMGNPALYPLIYETATDDIIIVHINPVVREEVPRTPMQIMNRINEISFNSSLLREIRTIDFAKRMVEENWIKDEAKDKFRFTDLYVHSIRSDEATTPLSVSSKYTPEWNFLRHLRDQGRKFTEDWLEQNFDHIGEKSTIDLRAQYE